MTLLIGILTLTAVKFGEKRTRLNKKAFAKAVFEGFNGNSGDQTPMGLRVSNAILGIRGTHFRPLDGVTA